MIVLLGAGAARGVVRAAVGFDVAVVVVVVLVLVVAVTARAALVVVDDRPDPPRPGGEIPGAPCCAPP